MFRSFQIDGRWNIIYYPRKPSGFSIFIIGDNHQYVDNQDSFWLHHPGRLQLLDDFKANGYTVFSSDFTSGTVNEEEQALFARDLYHLVMKSEILNEHIHIFAEGKGAAIALKLMEFGHFIRSAVFLNPTFETEESPENTAHHSIMASTASANMNSIDANLVIPTKTVKNPRLPLAVPIKFIHVMGDEECTTQFKRLQRKNLKETTITHLPMEKRYKVPLEAIGFYKKHENVL